MANLPQGIYEALLDEELNSILQQHPELRSVFGKLDPEEEPARYAAFLARLLEKALRLEDDPATRLRLCNEIIERIAGAPTASFLIGNRLVAAAKSVLLEITPPQNAEGTIQRPETPLTESSLFTGSPSDPQLVHELGREMRSADSVDLLISFIKWSGLRLLMPAFEEITTRGGAVRIITTSYMGASDAEAIEWLAGLPNVSIRVSYDTDRTRLHAKAYHFKRLSGFSTAYIGSANMSHAAMTSGLEWNLKVTAQDLPHILEKFIAEFETYWNSREFLPFNPAEPMVLRDAIQHARRKTTISSVLVDMTPHPFQERILDALAAERLVHDRWRNLIVAATGTGKTVVAAFDFKRFYLSKNRQARLLFVAHIDVTIYNFNSFQPSYENAVMGNAKPVFYCPLLMFKGQAIMVKTNSGIQVMAAVPGETKESRETRISKAAQQLKGKRVAVTKGTELEQIVLAALKKGNLTEQDITLIHASPEDSLAAFLAGNVDAFAAGLTERVEARRHGAVELLETPDVMHPAINGIVTTEAFATQHKEVLDKLVLLWFRTVNFMEKDLKQNSTNILSYLSKVASTRYTPDEYVVAWTFDVFPHDAKEADKLFNDPSSSAYWKTTWDANNEFLMQQGKTKTPVPYSAYWGETNLSRLSKE